MPTEVCGQTLGHHSIPAAQRQGLCSSAGSSAASGGPRGGRRGSHDRVLLLLPLIIMAVVVVVVVVVLLLLLLPVVRVLLALLLLVEVVEVPLVGQQRVDVLVGGRPLGQAARRDRGAHGAHAELLVPEQFPRTNEWSRQGQARMQNAAAAADLLRCVRGAAATQHGSTCAGGKLTGQHHASTIVCLDTAIGEHAPAHSWQGRAARVHTC